jgi:tRNA threonylcarbamoyladenosine biosynthesis protein TsaB
MLVLSLDSTTRAGSVAVVDDDRVLVEKAGDATRSHAERLPAELLAALGDAGASIHDVDVFAVASGPGSFTGLRVGIATVQGLALATARGVVAVSALDALAHVASGDAPDSRVIGVWMDAFRREVFSGLYRVTNPVIYSKDRLEEIEGPVVAPAESTLARWLGLGYQPDVWIGDGAAVYSTVIAGLGELRPTVPIAAAIGRLAISRSRAHGTIDPAAIQPLYVRRPDAEVARER